MQRSGGESFIDEGMVTVRLLDRGNGIEVQLHVRGRICWTEVTLIPIWYLRSLVDQDTPRGSCAGTALCGQVMTDSDLPHATCESDDCGYEVRYYCPTCIREAIH